MKTYRPLMFGVLTVLAFIALLLGGALPGSAQVPQPGQPSPESALVAPPAGFTYQGRLDLNNQPYNGSCDFQFSLWDSQSAGVKKQGPVTNTAVGVTNGLFSTLVNLSNTYTEATWLEIAVRCPAGAGGYTTLAGRTQITAAPFATGLRYGSSIQPSASAGNAFSGLLVSAGAAESGITNPVAIIGLSSQSAGSFSPFIPSVRTGVFGASDSGYGIMGQSGSGFGVNGISASGTGVVGTSGSGSGVSGSSDTGSGVTGTSNAITPHVGGVNGTGSKVGVYGQSTTGDGVLGESDSGPGVHGNSISNIGVIGGSSSNYGLYGHSSLNYGLFVESNAPCCKAAARVSNYSSAVGLWASTTGANAGIFGQGVIGIVGEATSNGGTGVIGRLGPGVSSGWAGQFMGNVQITGSVFPIGVELHIDHPLDPANQYLNQAAMFAPEMLNVYSGNVVTDQGGYATIKLPAYVEAFNKDFRYQLTVVGQFAQAIVSTKLKNGQFIIQTDKPNVEVSWQVSGVRQDAYALANPLVVEQAKPVPEQGLYLFPQGYGQPASQGLVNLYSQSARVDASQVSPAYSGVP